MIVVGRVFLRENAEEIGRSAGKNAALLRAGERILKVTKRQVRGLDASEVAEERKVARSCDLFFWDSCVWEMFKFRCLFGKRRRDAAKCFVRFAIAPRFCASRGEHARFLHSRDQL